MTKEMESCFKLMDSDSYKSLLDELKATGLKFSKEDRPLSRMMILLQYPIKFAKKSGVEVTELEKLISTNVERHKVINFILETIEFFADDIIDEGADEPPELIEVLPFEKELAITPLIEYYLLENNLSVLEKALVSLRMPRAKKYVQDLKQIYDKVQ